MAISYRNRLIEFNKRKHKAILERAGDDIHAQQYFVAEDYDYIKNLSPIVAKIIWDELIFNIEYRGEWGISQNTCTFCIERRLMTWKCPDCEWGKNHKLCKVKSGDFQKIQKYLKKNSINTITHDEYLNIIKEVRSIIK